MTHLFNYSVANSSLTSDFSRKQRLLRAWLVGAAGTVAASACWAGPVLYVTIAYTSQPAAGLPAGTVFADLADTHGLDGVLSRAAWRSAERETYRRADTQRLASSWRRTPAPDAGSSAGGWRGAARAAVARRCGRHCGPPRALTMLAAPR